MSTTVLAYPLQPSYPTPLFKTNFFPGFGFFVKIHLLESLKLELYGFRSYSFMIIFGGEMWNVSSPEHEVLMVS